jgi:hypothetical protein
LANKPFGLPTAAGAGNPEGVASQRPGCRTRHPGEPAGVTLQPQTGLRHLSSGLTYVAFAATPSGWLLPHTYPGVAEYGNPRLWVATTSWLIRKRYELAKEGLRGAIDGHWYACVPADCG